MKLYEGAFLPNFQWPQPNPASEETSEEEGLFGIFENFSIRQKQDVPPEKVLGTELKNHHHSSSLMKEEVGNIFNM